MSRTGDNHGDFDDDRERLARGLHRQADRLPAEASFGPDDVRRTARGIERRRRVAVAVAAAAVVAVAVPATFAATGTDRADHPLPPATATPSPDPSPTDTPTPTSPTPVTPDPAQVRTVRLSADTEQHSPEPAIPYLLDGQIVRPDGSMVPLAVDADQVAALGDGWVTSGSDNQGRRTVYFVNASGQQIDSEPSSGGLAVSADGTLVSYATRSGALMVTWDGASSPTQLRTEGPGELSPVVVQGSGRCDNPEGVGGCMVYYNQMTADGETTAKVSDRHGIVDDLEPFHSIASVSAKGWLAGLVSATDYGSCSVVLDQSYDQLWKTCDYKLDRFSPDGRYVIGRPAYSDGLGDSEVAILDAKDGTPLVQYDTGRDSFINGSAWDTDGTLLTLLYDDGWALMRLTRDGHVSSVSRGRIPGPAESVPLHFAARP